MEYLIDRVREKTILWDVNHLYFRDGARKRDAWDMVAEECGYRDGEQAKHAWAKLRNSHREAMRRRIEDRNLRPWKYEEKMEWLLTCNSDSKRSKDKRIDENYEIETIHVEIDDFNDSDDETSPSTHVKDKIVTRIGKSNYTNASFEGDFDNSERNKRMLKKHPFNEDKVRDGLTELFTSLCEKTRNLPKHLQLRVQREMFNSITKAEEDILRSARSSTMIRKKVIPKRLIKK